jgi:hypothetical protein
VQALRDALRKADNGDGLSVETLLKQVDFSMALEDKKLLLQVTHEHHEAENTDMLHASTRLYATIQRIDALCGSWSIHRSPTGSVMRASFPWGAISPE